MPLQKLAPSANIGGTLVESKIEQVQDHSQSRFSILYTPTIDFVFGERLDSTLTTAFQISTYLPQFKVPRMFCDSAYRSISWILFQTFTFCIIRFFKTRG